MIAMNREELNDLICFTGKKLTPARDQLCSALKMNEEDDDYWVKEVQERELELRKIEMFLMGLLQETPPEWKAEFEAYQKEESQKQDPDYETYLRLKRRFESG